MLKKEICTAINPLLVENKDEFLDHVNNCLQKHTGNPLKHSKLLKFTAELLGYDHEQQLGKLPLDNEREGEKDPFWSHDYPFS